jgi:DNA invertase Pin-like site-specific DNA recombinase
VSTADQDPGMQLAALEKAGCWPIHQETKSGKHGAVREVRDATLKSLKRGDTLTVWKLDRLGRSTIELNAIVQDLKARGVNFRSLTEHIDTNTAQGMLFFQLLAAFAEFERQVIIERTRAAKQHMIAEGRHPGGARVFGYGKDRATQIPAEAALLREAAEQVLNGTALARIIDDWNQRDIPTKTGRGRWHETMLRRMLQNPRIVGIIDADTHKRLEALFDRPDRQRQGAPAVHLLGGILRCGREGCGQPMYAGTERGKPVYRCKRATGTSWGYPGCGKTSVTMSGADEWMTEAFIAHAVGPSFTTTLNARRAALLAGDLTPQQLDALREELGDYEALPARFQTTETRTRRTELQRLVRQATAQLLARPELEELSDLPKSEDKLREKWESWSIEQRRHYLRAVLEYVYVLPAPNAHTGRFDGDSRLDPRWRF